MDALSRSLMAAYLCATGVALWRPAHAAERTTKTAKECSEELQRNAAALEAAGESASAFFHRCWYHSEAGMPTPIKASDEGAASSNSDGATKHPSGTARQNRPAARRHYAERRIPRRREREDEESTEPGITDSSAQVAAPPLAAPLPSRVNVNVPAMGTVSIPILPLPGLAATVRVVVDHPVVPGLVTTSP